MNAHTALASALLITFCKTSSLQVPPSAGHIADENPAWRSTLEKHSYRSPATPADFERQALSHQPTCVRPIYRWDAVQPLNERAATAIVGSLAQTSRVDRRAVVTIVAGARGSFRERSFKRALDTAFRTVGRRSRSVLIVGIDPRRPEVKCAWIEPGAKASGRSGIHQVVAFQEESSAPVPETRLRTGSVWNSVVMIGQIFAFLELAWIKAPRLFQALGVGNRFGCK